MPQRRRGLQAPDSPPAHPRPTPPLAAEHFAFPSRLRAAETYIVQDRATLLEAVLYGEPIALALAQAITRWLEQVMDGVRARCLACDARFDPASHPG